MYIAPEQVRESLRQLQWVHPFYGIAFLAMKQARLPIGVREFTVVSRAVDELMQRHYKPAAEYAGFYQPFASSDPQDRWVSPRYPSTSIQRIMADTFGDVFLHEKGSQDWGWRTDYIDRLRSRLDGQLIPAFDLAVWLFRDIEFPPHTLPGELVEQLIAVFNLSDLEIHLLFDVAPHVVGKYWLRDVPALEEEILDIIGHPPGSKPALGAILDSLRTVEVGPARNLVYDPSSRLNLITGNNSLGKSFLLDLIWWSLTGNWAGLPAEPRGITHAKPSIRTVLTTNKRRGQDTEYKYGRHLGWESSKKNAARAGLVLYARYDGSFAIWDEARIEVLRAEGDLSREWFFLTRENVWDGLEFRGANNRTRYICNGLINDWLLWQTSGVRYEDTFTTFSSALWALSPTGQDHPLAPGEPTRIGIDTREFPTLRMPYGEIPLIHASAGVKRVIALAYMLVWAWYEHLRASTLIGRKPQSRMVIIVDEIEAHLHPLWQRQIVRSLLNVIRILSDQMEAQLHIATHSPLVLASVEPYFEWEHDQLHHLSLVGSEVRLEEIPFVKRGTADLWLMSEAFGLEQARSAEAEDAIEDATSLQMEDDPSPAKIREVNRRLLQLLAQDDEFWPMWRYFAKTKGDLQ